MNEDDVKKYKQLMSKNRVQMVDSSMNRGLYPQIDFDPYGNYNNYKYQSTKSFYYQLIDLITDREDLNKKLSNLVCESNDDEQIALTKEIIIKHLKDFLNNE